MRGNSAFCHVLFLISCRLCFAALFSEWSADISEYFDSLLMTYSSDTVYSDTVSGACYPHVNLSVPAVTIWPTIEAYINNRDVSILQQLTTNDSVLRHLWKLELSKYSSLYSDD